MIPKHPTNVGIYMLMDMVITVIKTNFVRVGILDIRYTRCAPHLESPSCKAYIYASYAATT